MKVINMHETDKDTNIIDPYAWIKDATEKE